MLGISTTNARVGGFRGGKKFSTEALAWRTNIIANGGTIPDATLAIFDANFFKPAKANGNILSELDRLNIYCGLVGYEIAARTNVIKSAHYVTPVSSPTFDNNGYKSSGTSYLNLNYNAKTQGIKLTLNSASMFHIVKDDGNATQRRALGSYGSANERLDQQRAVTTLTSNLNDVTGTINSTIPASGKVFCCVIRTASNAVKSIGNTNEASATTASIAIPDFVNFELCLNFQGIALAPFDDKYHLASGHGSGNLDYANLRIILNNLFTALGL
jgi:hypothetical protein